MCITTDPSTIRFDLSIPYSMASSTERPSSIASQNASDIVLDNLYSDGVMLLLPVGSVEIIAKAGAENKPIDRISERMVLNAKDILLGLLSSMVALNAVLTDLCIIRGLPAPLCHSIMAVPSDLVEIELLQSLGKS